MARFEVQVWRDIADAARAAGGLLDRGAQPCLFDRLDWFRLTLAYCPPPGRPLILRAGDTRLFLMQDRGTVRALGSWYTLRHGPIGTAAAADLDAIARALRRAARIELQPSIDPAPLAAALRRAGWFVRSAPSSVNWRTHPSDWSGWWAARPGRLRETVRRKGRGAPFRIAIHDRFDAGAWADYEAAYARSWKPAEGSPAFLRALAEQEGMAGTLRLGLAYDGARPVAAQLWLVERGIATIHKLAYDEADRARSPGTLLSHAMFRHAIEVERVRTIDFGLGDEPYKADWMDEARPVFRIDAWNPRTLRGVAGLARAASATLVRRARRR